MGGAPPPWPRLTPRPGHGPSWLAALVVASACSPQPDARDVSTDRAEQSAEVVAEIGVIEGPEQFVFGRIVGVAADPAGHVYVLDEQTSDLRVYSPSGDFLKVVAREGDGPGEIRRPFGLNFAADDRLYVRDQNGVSVFVPGSEAEVSDSLVETFRGPMYPRFDSRRSEVTADGTYYYPFYLFQREGPERFFYLPYRDGLLQPDTLAVPPFSNLSSRREAFVRLSAGSGRYFPGLSVAPFEPVAVFDVTPRGTVIGGDATDYLLVEVDAHGDTVATIRGEYQPREIDAGERADSASALQARLDSVPVPLTRVQNLSPWVERGDLPDTYPPYIDVWSGGQGRTWVRRWPRNGGELFDVYGPNGESLGSVHLPVRIDRSVPPHFGGGAVTAVTRDPLTDVQKVVRVVFELDG